MNFRKGSVVTIDGVAGVRHGPTTLGYGFATSWEGFKEPGAVDTELTLRRVRPPGTAVEEVQILVSIAQHYRSGAPTRQMAGSMTLKRDALVAFAKAVLELEP